MMPDLGNYATSVLSAYGVGIVLLVALVAMSLFRSARVKAELDAIEARRKDG